MSYFVGAYASSPCTSGWDPELESQFYDELKKQPKIKGLEHPFLGTSLHANDDDWFLRNIDPDWQFVFTCVPGTMGALGKNPDFGIASDNEEGREQAVAFLARARDAIAKLNKHAGKQVVTAIEIQTAPNQSNASSSTASLIKTLETIVEWDWLGARVVIEHCDTLVAGQKPAKGFLSAQQEIEAIKQVNESKGADLGFVVNWGRSVIETRSESGAIDHIDLAKQAGVLAGLMFSGVSAVATPYGEWADTHMPAEKSEQVSIGAENSLMTERQIHNCVRAANVQELDIVGIKLGIRPKDESIANRVAYNVAALEMIAGA